MESLNYQSVNPYIFNIYQLSFNIKTKEIIEKTPIKHILNINHGYLFICDNIQYTINTFLNKNMLNSSIIVTHNKSIWLDYLKNYNCVICNINELSQYKNKKFSRIIYDNIVCCKADLNINVDKKWYISNKVSNITIDHLEFILNTFLNIKVNNIDESILYSLSKIIFYSNQ